MCLITESKGSEAAQAPPASTFQKEGQKITSFPPMMMFYPVNIIIEKKNMLRSVVLN